MLIVAVKQTWKNELHNTMGIKANLQQLPFPTAGATIDE
jgi:hypothetical protein